MSALNPSGRAAITILVLGDGGVGKSSLISSLVSESWSERVPPVLQPVMVPPSLLPEGIQLTIIDTSSDPAHEAEWLLHLRPPPVGVLSSSSSSKALLQADAVLLVVAADVPDSFARVESYWLPLLESQAAKYGMTRRPVVLAVNKSSQQDGSGRDHAGGAGVSTSSSTGASSTSLSSFNDDLAASSSTYIPPSPQVLFDHLLNASRISAVIGCSAKFLYHLSHVFWACRTVILAPIEPLFDLHAPPLLPAASSTQGTGAGTGSSGSTAVAAVPGAGVGSGAANGVMRFKILTQKALLRIFRLFDRDEDGVLSFQELDAMHQVNFKGKKLAAQAFDELMRKLAITNREFVRATGTPSTSTSAGGATSAVPTVGLTFSGLLHFHFLFLQKNRHLGRTWALVQLFGYALGPVLPPQQQQQLQQQQQQQQVAQPTSAGGANNPTPSLVRSGSLGASSSSTAASSSSAAGVAPATSSTSSTSPPPAPLPSMGSLVLKESYCSLSAVGGPGGGEGQGSSFHPALSYELSTVAVEFLTALFKKYDSDKDGLLCIKVGTPSGAAASATDGVAAPAAVVVVDASPSSTCSLSASSDLDRAFLASPDVPFAVPSFAKFVTAIPAAAIQVANASQGRTGASFVNLDGWLAAWALLLYNYSTVPLAIPTAATPSAAAFAPSLSATSSSSSVTTGNLSASFGSLSTLANNAAAPSSPPVPAPGLGHATGFVPNPDIILRYLHYLCFPVVPAMPEFTWSDPVAASANAKAKPPTKVYLPAIQRCIHVTPRARFQANIGGGGGGASSSSSNGASAADVELAQQLNERILGTDGGLSGSAARNMAMDPSSLRPRTLVCFVMGSTGAGKTAMIDCMLGNAPVGGVAAIGQPVSTATVAGLNIAKPEAAVAAAAAPTEVHIATVQHPRTFATRLPLSHLPAHAPSPLQPAGSVDQPPAAAAAAAAAASAAGPIDATLQGACNRFLLLKEIPASLSAPLLTSPGFSSASCDLLLLLYDGSSAPSLAFVLQRLQVCFEKRIPVLVVQTKGDYANCTLAKNDFASIDFDVHVESFSSRLFWSSVLQPSSASSTLPAVCTIFERIYHAARQPSPYILSSLSASRRSSHRSRMVLCSLLAGATAVAAWFTAPWLLARLAEQNTAWAQRGTPRGTSQTDASAATRSSNGTRS